MTPVDVILQCVRAAAVTESASMTTAARSVMTEVAGAVATVAAATSATTAVILVTTIAAVVQAAASATANSGHNYKSKGMLRATTVKHYSRQRE